MEKSLTDNKKFEAAAFCLEKRIPFCLYSLPNGEPVFFSNPSGESFDAEVEGRKFIVSEWNKKLGDSSCICDELDDCQTISFLNESFPTKESVVPWQNSTTKEEYLHSVQTAISELKEKCLGKVVISRTLCKRPGLKYQGWCDVARKVFEAYPETFRFLYWTSATGAWLGSSPELLLNYDRKACEVTTVALAGTRNISSENGNDWDSKDSEEQHIVSSFLMSELEKLGLDVLCENPKTVDAAHLQHICTVIKGKAVNNDLPSYEDILYRIQPSPALSGFPVEEAKNIIRMCEKHPRRCYGGFIGVEEGDRFRAYVNIRSVHFDENTCCLYAGGGILPQSDPESEWKETEGKLRVLLKFLD